MKYYFAPMEGITGYCFRQVHHKFFPGLDAYYTPFIAANKTLSFSGREKKEFDPLNNKDIPTVPQLMGNDAGAFLFAAGEMAGRGYGEINFNLGCPASTVVSHHRGAGMLADTERLDAFFDEVFEGLEKHPLPAVISVKTRIGMTDPDELPAILDVYEKYPIAKLIVHPRVRSEFYSGEVHEDAFAYVLERARCPVVYNGDIRSMQDIRRIAALFPEAEGIMCGRGLLIDPAMLRGLCGEEDAAGQSSGALVRKFHNELISTYLREYGDEAQTLSKMKEIIYWLGQGYENSDKLVTRMRHSKDLPEYRMYAEKMFSGCAYKIKKTGPDDE
ncbi:MAG: tRNA-dihydrouridine synthase family protein [Lachnospiraceae bacterium]|nr:tRNA-dihydrouridine synthase family protein [Lachnospiraceae bacterium]